MSSFRIRFPHPLVLVIVCIVLAAGLSYVIPAGKYERRIDPTIKKEVVVPNTYKKTPPTPVPAFQAVVAVPKGMASASAVIFYVFLVGGAFAVVEKTGALSKLVNSLVKGFSKQGLWIIPICCVVFGLGGFLVQMQEELIAFIPILLLLGRRMGYDRITLVAMSLGAAAVGAAFSPINPFQVQIGQNLAGVPYLSGAWFRMLVLVPAMGLWILMTLRYAMKNQGSPEQISVKETTTYGIRQDLVLVLVLITFGLFIYAANRPDWDWGFDEYSALFFLMGIIAGLIGGLKINGTAEAFVEGLKSMGFAALLIGFTKTISVVLAQGNIIDTFIHGLSVPLQKLPKAASAIGMMGIQTIIHLPVPSTSGQAALTLPIMAPLADILGISRQIVVLAYQYGAGLCEIVTPTNGALMAMLAAAGIQFSTWLRFALKAYLLLMAVAIAALLIATMIHLP